jgi:predicted TPR repeat methyltransferase
LRQIQHSSGDLTVDRRAAFAEAMALDKDFVAAAEVMAGAVEAAPHWAAGWLLLGDYLAAAGDEAGAVAAYGQVEVLDVEGVFGAALKLAAHGGTMLPGGTDRPYVEALFDEYAPRFEAELVGDLGYDVPAVLARMIAEALTGRLADRAVDLGCGTGLMGAQIRRFCERLEGVDLSARMLAAARHKGIYDRLVQAELVDFLRADSGGIGLMTAADVLNYCGPLSPVLVAAFAVLSPGGLFGFSLELHDRSGTLLRRRELRYAHNGPEALAECAAAGFEIAATKDNSIRNERGAPVPGLLVVVRKPA